MSINHFSSDLPQKIWWGQHQPHIMEPSPIPPNPIWSTSATKTTLTFNLNQQDYGEQELQSEIKEAMFEKSLTPSDVGKLNRLVIPKQHAERYFPLATVSRLDSGEKGLLLNFEDDLGKLWRFRYSYWSSSQSYVLTKGWSRFVKEKRLDAGDVVFFERHPVEADRFFIGWRPRATSSVQDSGLAQPPVDGGGWTRVFYSAHPYPSHSSHGSLLPYQPDCLHAGPILANQTTASGKSKRLRLFGVNLECQPDEPDPPATDGSPMLSEAQPHHYQYHSKAHSPDFQNHRDINFARDVNQMRYHQG